MGQRTTSKVYHCDEDCEQQGCPTHIAVLEFNSITNIYRFRNGKGTDIYMDSTQMDALIEMQKQLSNGCTGRK